MRDAAERGPHPLLEGASRGCEGDGEIAPPPSAAPALGGFGTSAPAFRRFLSSALRPNAAAATAPLESTAMENVPTGVGKDVKWNVAGFFIRRAC
jgi:hypothetical protein